MMMKVTRQSIGLGLALIAVMVGATVAAPRPSYPVRVTIADAQSDIGLLIQSDRLGDYEQNTTVRSSIEEYKSGYTDWLFTTYVLGPRGKVTPSNRTVFFNLAEPASPDNPPAPVGAEYLQAHFVAGCTDASVNMLRIPAGATVLCPGSFRFQALDGRWFRLAMNPSNFADVNPLSVTCTADDGAGCHTWRLTPSSSRTTGTDPNPKNVTKLLRIDANGNVLEQLGNYYISFSIELRR